MQYIQVGICGLWKDGWRTLPRAFSILLNLGVPVASASEVRSPAIELGNLVAGGVVEGAGHDSQQRHHAGVVDLGLQESLLWRRGWDSNPRTTIGG